MLYMLCNFVHCAFKNKMAIMKGPFSVFMSMSFSSF